MPHQTNEWLGAAVCYFVGGRRDRTTLTLDLPLPQVYQFAAVPESSIGFNMAIGIDAYDLHTVVKEHRNFQVYVHRGLQFGGLTAADLDWFLPGINRETKL